MKKRLDKEEMLGLLVVVGGIFLICGWIAMFIIMPIIGIGEAIKYILEISKDNYFIVIGNIGAFGAIIIIGYFIYEYLLSKLQQKLSRKKMKKIKIASISIIGLILFLVIITIYLVLKKITVMMLLSYSIMHLFGIEVILLALGLLLITNNYTNKKIKNEDL